MILSITLNPCIDHTLIVDGLKPFDTNRVLRTETDAGGKGVNLSRVAVELGAMSLATGLLGGGAGAFIREVLKKQQVLSVFVRIRGHTRTNFSVEDGSSNSPTTFNEPGPQIQPKEWEDLLEKVEFLATRAKWVAVGGSLPPGIPPDAHKTLLEIAQKHHCKTVLDADGEPMKLALMAHPTMIKPNDKEAARLLGEPIETQEQALAAARKLHEGGVPIVILSRGSKGAVLACEEGLFIGQSPQVESKSTIGSGDSMIAGFLVGLERGQTIEEAFRLSLAAGAATATTDGSEIAKKPMVERLLPEAQVIHI